MDKQVGYVDSPKLFTVGTLSNRFDREKTTQIDSESFNATAAYLKSEAVLVLYANGMATGLVLDSGHEITHSVPVLEGNPIYTGISTMELGGMNLTKYLQK